VRFELTTRNPLAFFMETHAMKPIVVITGRIHSDAIDLLESVCDVVPINICKAHARHEFALLAGQAQGLMAAVPDRIDDVLLRDCPRLRIVACTFRLPEHVDIAECTRRGIWVTNVMARWLDKEAEIEAARNILDALGGDTPRGVINDMTPTTTSFVRRMPRPGDNLRLNAA
jgi:phosphoglycerate dehydrogenase-like enzyme